MTPPVDIERLFREPRMFDSADTFRAAGFEVKGGNEHNIMVGGHASAPGYLFKKYRNAVSSSEQIANYERRVEGARRLRKFIEGEHLRHITVPRKWICDLPSSFPSRKILVVDRMDVLPPKDTERRYRSIHKDVLKELCSVLNTFRWIDAAPHNLSFLRSGQIAVIDTEDWDNHKRDRHFIKNLLSGSARKLFEQMEHSAPRGQPPGAEVKCGHRRTMRADVRTRYGRRSV